ncbi:MAG: molybdopterin cofactor-binding domain-containing protein [Granulosicoccus sp.]
MLDKYIRSHDATTILPVAGVETKTVLQNVSRRSFLKNTTGLVVALQFVPMGEAFAFEEYAHGGQGMPNGVNNDPNVFVSIEPDGTVTLVSHRSEMGTGVRTSIPLVIAEEMDADWSRVKITQAEGDEKKYGNQDTDGSRSLRHHVQPAREIGAAVRLMLEQAAAKQWGVSVGDVQAINHEVVEKTGSRKLGYGELATAAMDLPTPERSALKFKDETDFRYLGKGEVSAVDLLDITTGHAQYGADVELEGKLFAVIARPPVVGGTIKSYDSSAAEAIPGVIGIEEVPGSGLGSKFRPLGGIAVIATNTWTAIKARKALKIEWDAGEHGSFSTVQFEQELRDAVNAPGTSVREQGNTNEALEGATRVVAQEYYQKFNVHSPMEPPVALASFSEGKLDIWAPVQSPYGTRLDLAEFLKLNEEDVTVNVTLLGGGFGRKSKCDFVIEAAWLSQQLGKPIQVQWTREDDIRHSYHHASSVERIEVGLDGNAKVIAWRHRSAQPSFLSTFVPDEGAQHPIEIGMGLEDCPYEIPNMQAEYGKAFAHTRIGWFRSVSHVQRAFAIQSMTAELAHELGRDQKEFLLEMIGTPRNLDWQKSGLAQAYWNHGEPLDEFPIDTSRMRKVIELVTEKAGWGKELPEGEALGLAFHRSFVSNIAAVVHAKVDEKGNLSVPEVHTAIDCGYVANPERVRSQMEGACVFGMTSAVHGGITFENGAVVESNFHDNKVMRSTDYPQNVHVHITPHPFSVHATGVGEPGVPPVLPALTNAIFNATGKRIRNLPIANQLEV